MPPVITIDGPGGTGKGTVSQLLANALGWYYLDSGALYRVLAFAALQQGVALENESGLSTLGQDLQVDFTSLNHQIRTLLNGQDITDFIRSEVYSNAASRIAILPAVRTALATKLRALRKWPGLITDGRDMGTVIFPDAKLKFFLQATLEERAKRRYKQLKSKQVHASLETILEDLTNRDKRDKNGEWPL